MKEEKVLINGRSVNYKTAGKGLVFLILHGWGSKSDKWKEVISQIADNGFKVIAPDLPGFGKSDQPQKAWGVEEYADFVEQFVSSLNLNKLNILGHSFGGAVAVKYTQKFPHRIKKIILVGAALFRRKKLKLRVFYIFSKIFKILKFLPFYNKLRKAIYKFIIRKSDYPYTKGLMKSIYLKVIKQDLTWELSQIKNPALIIWGENDKVKPLKEAHKINQILSNSELKIISEVGHSPYYKKPSQLTNLIINFLKS